MTSTSLIEAEANCPLCHKPTENILSRQLRRGSGVVYYCGGCHHGFLVPELGLDTKTYYAEIYRQEYSHNAQAAETNARELFDVYRHYQRDRLRLIQPFLSNTTHLLEVGASSGQFLVNIKDQIETVNAIELDKACCAFMQNELGIPSDSEYLRESKFADNSYDVICSFQVMEHVPDPVVFLQELRQSTKKGGTILVEVPNLHDPLLSVWGVNSYKKFFYHSAHLHYFTEDSLKIAAEMSGFKLEQVSISFTQDYNLLNHLSWVMNDAPQATCHIGLSPVNLVGSNREISDWLTQQITQLNTEYLEKLVAAKATSNLMMVLTNV
jgi:2-polyprenyl-3-methyl-5-hydroxy-6-metoxy-1,4-benzoquinol methylase